MEKSPADFTPPSLKITRDIVKPFKAYFQPRFYGLEELDMEKPALFISNHTLLGLTDGFFIGQELYEQKGVFLRALADNLHFGVPFWSQLARTFGFLPGSRENCTALMEAGQSILVFPGGTREVCKLKGELYTLTWKKRVGFARMAIQHGYDIIPVAGVGGDDLFSILFDSVDIMDSAIGKWLGSSGIAGQFLKGGENIPPIVRGVGLTPLPRPERLYFSYGKRIDTTRFKGNADDKEALWTLREETRLAMIEQFEDLFAKRREDAEPEEWWRKVLKKL